MSPILKVNVPSELFKEIAAYVRVEGQTTSEFIIWALGEKIGELRQSREIKNLAVLDAESDGRTKPTNIPPLESGEKTQKKLMNAEEAAKVLNVSKRKVYHMMQAGELPVVRIGKAVRLREDDLETYIQKSHQDHF